VEALDHGGPTAPDGGGTTFVVTWVAGLLRRRWARLAGTLLSVALAVAFVASLGELVTASKAHITREALAGVPVDLQVQPTPGGDGAGRRRRGSAGGRLAVSGDRRSARFVPAGSAGQRRALGGDRLASDLRPDRAIGRDLRSVAREAVASATPRPRGGLRSGR